MGYTDLAGPEAFFEQGAVHGSLMIGEGAVYEQSHL